MGKISATVPRRRGLRGLLRRLLFPSPPAGEWKWWLPAVGRCWLLTAALLLAVGLFKTINPVILLSYLLLAAMGLNALAAGRHLRRLRARFSVEGPVFAGTPFVVDVRVENPGRRAIHGVALADVGPDHELNCFAARIPPRATRSFRVQLVLPRRGQYTWGSLAAISGYPFNLVRRREPLAGAQEVVVLPRLGWIHRGRLRRVLRQASPEGDAIRRRRPQRHPSAQAEFHGLRAWRPGDSPRFIHWRTSARRGELMVREYEDVPSDNLLLVLDTALPPGFGAAERFEDAVSLAATICWEWCLQTGDRLLVVVADNPGRVLDGVAGPAHARKVLECLALAQGGPASDAGALQSCLAGYAEIAAAAMVVSAGASSLTGPVARALRRPVTCLDASAAEVGDFYQPPAGSEGGK
jgi:uncharacterized protein (DUF58 family)